MRIDDHAQLRVESDGLGPATAKSPELMAPLARALNNGKCAVCGARVWGVADPSLEIPQGRVQIACWGDPKHVFIYDTVTGHIDDQPTVMGTLPPSGD